jgi:N-acetylglutamate synthase-like GNAT family acetyltransferase
MPTVRPGTWTDLDDENIRTLVLQAIYKSDTKKIEAFLRTIDFEKTKLYCADENGQTIGLLVASQKDKDLLEITNIVTAKSKRRSGVGRALVTDLIAKNPNTKIEAETNNDAVGFYHALGFRILCLGEKYPEVVRYKCIFDHLYWEPYPFKDILKGLQSEGILCWLSGGRAIDLFLGRQTRKHTDTDISILRKDQTKFGEVYRDWEVYHTHAPGLRIWNRQEYLAQIPNLWLRNDAKSAWRFEVMFHDSIDDLWFYRRNRQITRKIEEIGFVSDDGIPYLRPEIQLLYKGGGISFRPHDFKDLELVLPLLPRQSKEWLKNALRIEFPKGHDWIDYIDQF